MRVRLLNIHRNPRGTLAEFAPALLIGITVIFFIIGFAFYICGVATAYFACQAASREGATGGSRSQMQLAARQAATRVADSGIGNFAQLRAAGGGAFVTGVTVNFFRINPATPGATPTPFGGGNVDGNQVYTVRVESNYQVTVPFIGQVRGFAASDNVVDNPEALSVN